MKILITFLFLIGSFSVLAANKSKGAKSPLVVGIIEEAHDSHVLVVTRDKYKRKLTFDENSTITYVGFDDAKKEIKSKCAIRAQVKDEVIATIYVTQDVGTDSVEPTPEMVKMTPAELFQVADQNKNGRVCYPEVSKTIHYSLKHGPVSFQKCDQDKSGFLSPEEFPDFLEKTKWWKMSRKTPEEWLKGSDQDKNDLLSKEELAVLLGSDAHIDIFFKRADKNTSGDVDLAEVSAFINELVFPSHRAKKQKKEDK